MKKIAFEVGASCIPIAGQWFGSTTRSGAVIYAVASVVWIVWMVRYRQWGVLFANTVGSSVSALNLAAAFR